MLRPRSSHVLLTALTALTGCAVPGGGLRPDVLPAREEGLSFLGEGHERIDRQHFEPVIFQTGSWRIDESERSKIARTAAGLGTQGRAILAGMGDESGPDEYSRVLGEARAQSVRQSLVASGVAAHRLQTVSYGSEWPEGADVDGLSRVVIGLVK